MEQIKLDLSPGRRLLTVSQLTAAIRSVLAKSFEDIWVAGEISGVKPAASGHVYFTLKDGGAQIRCACFRSTLRLLRCKPQEGIAVIARGRIDVFEPRGEYQLLVDWLEPQGLGALQLAFEQLKQKLEAEGLFAPGRKRALPRFPRRIGIVTSPDGAVIRDMLSILGRRWPGLQIHLYPALVQGPGSVEGITGGLQFFSRSNWADVVIVGRGGGSLEDLWSFNEEAVARAIADCRVPVISAVGHETDFTIADFVADLRAPTPSAAAELAVPNRSDLVELVETLARRQNRAVHLQLARAQARVHQLGIERAGAVLARRLNRAALRLDDAEARSREVLRTRIANARGRLQTLDLRLRRQDLRLRLSGAGRRLSAADQAIVHALVTRLSRSRHRMDQLAASLAQLSPFRVLERGYAIVQDPAGRVITSAAQTPPGDLIAIRLNRGRLEAAVTRSEME
jgi:exodeoxyribonuclease VII large subunit